VFLDNDRVNPELIVEEVTTLIEKPADQPQKQLDTN